MLIFLCGAVSAFSSNQTSYTVQKTVGQPTYIPITFTNNDNHTFFNVSLETNTYLTFPTITQMAPGTTVTMNATVTSDNPGTYALKIRGFYISDLGAQNTVYYINITSSSPFLSECDKSITAGDSVVWTNFVLDPITMFDASTDAPFEGVTINPSGGIYNKQFFSGTILRYYFKRASFIFTPTCTITVLNTSGLINNPAFDLPISLTINTQYTPTTINANVVNTNYTMDFDSTTDGVMSITNTGNLPAYNIHLSSDWILFGTNDFTLQSGQTKGVIYTVAPIITDSNQTNQAYTKNIQISGNFPTISIPLTIFINQANIGSGNNSDADYLIKVFCPKFPNSTLCNPAPRVEYRYIGNNTDTLFNATLGTQQLKDLWLYQFQKDDERKTFENEMKQMVFDMVVTQNKTQVDTAATKNDLAALRQDQESSVTNIYLTVGVVGTLLACALAGAVIFYYRKERKKEAVRQW